MQELQPVMVYPVAAVPADASTEDIYDAEWQVVAEGRKLCEPSADKQTVITDYWCLKGTGVSNKLISKQIESGPKNSKKMRGGGGGRSCKSSNASNSRPSSCCKFSRAPRPRLVRLLRAHGPIDPRVVGKLRSLVFAKRLLDKSHFLHHFMRCQSTR